MSVMSSVTWLSSEYTWKVDAVGLADGLGEMCWRQRHQETTMDFDLSSCKDGVAINQDDKGCWKGRFWCEEQE